MNRPVASSSGVEQTRSLAHGLAELMRPGDLVVLVGNLGTGKTAFTQGLGTGLGVDATITSPTFALVQSYGGRLNLHHLDVYRLTQVNQALDLDLAEMLDDEAVVVIEWGDTIAPVLPHDYLEVRLAYGATEVERRIEFLGVGSRWQARMRAVAAVVTNVCGEQGPPDVPGPAAPDAPVDGPGGGA